MKPSEKYDHRSVLTLAVPFAEKDWAKEKVRARWDANSKVWKAQLGDLLKWPYSYRWVGDSYPEVRAELEQLTERYERMADQRAQDEYEVACQHLAAEAIVKAMQSSSVAIRAKQG